MLVLEVGDHLFGELKDAVGTLVVNSIVSLTFNEVTVYTILAFVVKSFLS